MEKLILYIKNKITERFICFVVFVVILTGLAFVPGRYDLMLPSSTNDISKTIYIDK